MILSFFLDLARMRCDQKLTGAILKKCAVDPLYLATPNDTHTQKEKKFSEIFSGE